MRPGATCLFVIAGILTVGTVATDGAKAAVRVCGAHVTSKVVSAPRERDAKKAAIKDWTSKSKSKSIAHPSWRIANYKVLKCVERLKVHECVAHAAPCTIKQKVPRRPKRKKPFPSTGGTVV